MTPLALTGTILALIGSLTLGIALTTPDPPMPATVTATTPQPSPRPVPQSTPTPVETPAFVPINPTPSTVTVLVRCETEPGVPYIDFQCRRLDQYVRQHGAKTPERISISP